MAFNPNQCLKFYVRISDEDLTIKLNGYDFCIFDPVEGTFSEWSRNSITISQEDYHVQVEVYCKGDHYPAGQTFALVGNWGYITLTGNIMSLVDDGEGNPNSVNEDNAFANLFAEMPIEMVGDDVLNIVSAYGKDIFKETFRSTLIMGVPKITITEMGEGTFRGTFSGCQRITEIPEDFFNDFPELTPYCFQSMFSNCTYLEKVKDFPRQTQLAEHCFDSMFYSCWYLKEIPSWVFGNRNYEPYAYMSIFGNDNGLRGTIEINIDVSTEIKEGCFKKAFCLANLTEIKGHIKAPSAGDESFMEMFVLCQFNTLPENFFEIDSVGKSSFEKTFSNINQLTEISKPVIKAKTAEENAFNGIFSENTQLTAVKEDPIILETLSDVPGVFKGMYSNDVQLKEIKVSFSEWPSSEFFNDPYEAWVDGVAAEGTFYCPKGLEEEYGTNRIPEDWEIIHESIFNPDKCLKFINLSSTGTIRPDFSSRETTENYQLSKDGVTWSTELDIGPGEFAYIRGTSYPKGAFTMSGANDGWRVEGSITSLVDNGEGEAIEITEANAFQSFFLSQSNLVSVGEGLLPSTVLSENCYFQLFSGCSRLEEVPADLLPARVMAPHCYDAMFEECSSLKAAPNLPATTLADSCYGNLLIGCSSVEEITLPAKNLVKSCYIGMMNGSGIKKVTVGFTEWDLTNNPTNAWMMMVPENGTFIGPKQLEERRGGSYIPESWLFEKEQGEKIASYKTIQFMGNLVAPWNSWKEKE